MPTTVTKTIGGSGIRDYLTIQAWITATAKDITLATGDDTIQVGVLYDDGDYNESVNIEGATTSATNYRMLTVHSGHGYDPSTGEGVRWFNTVNPCKIKEDNFVLRGPMLVECTQTGSTNVKCVNVPNANTGIWIEGIAVKMDGGTGTNYGISILNGSASGNILNCLVIGSGSTTTGMLEGIRHDGVGLNFGLGPEIFQCSSYDVARTNGVGIRWTNGFSLGLNCASLDSGTLDIASGGWLAGGNRGLLSSDTTATGTGAFTNQTTANTWVDAPNGDFTPNHAGNLIDNGDSLASTYALNKDGDYVDYWGNTHNGDGGGREIGHVNHDTIITAQTANGIGGGTGSVFFVGATTSQQVFGKLDVAGRCNVQVVTNVQPSGSLDQEPGTSQGLKMEPAPIDAEALGLATATAVQPAQLELVVAGGVPSASSDHPELEVVIG